jgi:hypothetical protein
MINNFNQGESRLMKYILPILILLCSACTNLKPLPGSKRFTAYDFTKYSQQGFLFTPEGYSGSYQSVGMVNISFWPEVVKSEGTDADLEYRIDKDLDGNIWYIETLNMQTAIDSMYSKASQMGADAVIRFKTNFNTKNHGSKTIVGIELSGFAINRKENVSPND